MVRLTSGVIMAVVALSAMVWFPKPAFQLAVTILAAAAAFEYAPLAGCGTGVGRMLVVLSAMLVAWLVADVPSFSPLLSLGALLVAYELRFSCPLPNCKIGIAHVESDGYVMTDSADPSRSAFDPDGLFGLWIYGECYAP